MKHYDHTIQEKLQDMLVAIMAGCRTLNQVNTLIRPDLVLAKAWLRTRFAEQSNLSRMLDALQASHIEQLRTGHLILLKKHSQLRYHDWQRSLILDVDPTSLLASKRAEGSRKGWVSGRRYRYCRHVIRFMVAGYHETLLSLAYPGDRHGYEYFKPALKTLLDHYLWSEDQCQHIIIRSDAEQGTNANVSYGLWRKFQILMKGYSGRRTQAWVKRTPEAAWQVSAQNPRRAMALAPVTLRLGRHVDAYLLRWRDTRNRYQYATLLSTLDLPPFTLWETYDGRGGAEVEFRTDKSGLNLHLRRKHSLNAQEAWVILTDIAHNLLAWLQPWMLDNTAFASFGPERLVRDLLNIPGRLEFKDTKLTKVALWETHPYADEMRFCLHNMLRSFDLA
jgi:hypothetical protein